MWKRKSEENPDLNVLEYLEKGRFSAAKGLARRQRNTASRGTFRALRGYPGALGPDFHVDL